MKRLDQLDKMLPTLKIYKATFPEGDNAYYFDVRDVVQALYQVEPMVNTLQTQHQQVQTRTSFFHGDWMKESAIFGLQQFTNQNNVRLELADVVQYIEEDGELGVGRILVISNEVRDFLIFF